MLASFILCTYSNNSTGVLPPSGQSSQNLGVPTSVGSSQNTIRPTLEANKCLLHTQGISSNTVPSLPIRKKHTPNPGPNSLVTSSLNICSEQGGELHSVLAQNWKATKTNLVQSGGPVNLVISCVTSPLTLGIFLLTSFRAQTLI
jgi:hypothetical protein